MSITLLVWLFVFILQAGQMGRGMYTLLALSDLEQDFINPYDLSNKLNQYVMLEYAAQILTTVALILTGNWFCAILQAIILAYMAYGWFKGQVYVDATEAFKQLKPQQRRRGVLFGMFCVSFTFVLYRVVETTIHTFLTPEGRQVAKKLFKEAASSLHGY